MLFYHAGKSVHALRAVTRPGIVHPFALVHRAVLALATLLSVRSLFIPYNVRHKQGLPVRGTERPRFSPVPLLFKYVNVRPSCCVCVGRLVFYIGITPEHFARVSRFANRSPCRYGVFLRLLCTVHVFARARAFAIIVSRFVLPRVAMLCNYSKPRLTRAAGRLVSQNTGARNIRYTPCVVRFRTFCSFSIVLAMPF